MAGKKGTLLGRTLLKFIPETSPFHQIAEAVDLTAEAVIFDNKQNTNVPVMDLPEVKEEFVGKAKAVVMMLLEAGLIKLNIPGVKGANEEQVEKALLKIVEAYINEVVG